MNKCIIPTALLLTLALSNCSTISKYRNLGKSDQQVVDSKLPPTPLAAPQRVVRKFKYQPIYIAPKRSNVQVVTSTPIHSSKPAITTVRTTPGLMEPVVTGLPESKDLQESENVVPAYKPAQMPTLVPITPVAPLEIEQIPAPESIKGEATPIQPLIPTLQDVMSGDPNDGLIPAPGN